jgi:hypothetical protein
MKTANEQYGIDVYPKGGKKPSRRLGWGEALQRLLAIIMVAAAFAGASTAKAVIGDGSERFARRFESRMSYYPDKINKSVGWMFCDNGHWRTVAITFNNSVECEGYIAMTPASNTEASVMHQMNRLIATYTGKGRYAKRWTRYSIQRGWGYSRSDGLLFIEVSSTDTGFWQVSVASLLGYRMITDYAASQRELQQQPPLQQDEMPADQQRQQSEQPQQRQQPLQRNPNLYRL